MCCYGIDLGAIIVRFHQSEQSITTNKSGSLRPRTYQTILTCNFSNRLELDVGDGIVEGAAGLSEVVRVDVAHPDMSWLQLLR